MLSKNRQDQTRSSRVKKTVQFEDYDEVYDIPHIKNFSKGDIQNAYFSSKELQEIRAGCIDIVAQADKERRKGDGFYLRGLDQHTHKYKQTRRMFSRQVYDTVFLIQKFEKTYGIDASEKMAELCEKYSAPAVTAAQVAAMSDLFSAFKGSWSHRVTPLIQSTPGTVGDTSQTSTISTTSSKGLVSTSSRPNYDITPKPNTFTNKAA